MQFGQRATVRDHAAADFGNGLFVPIDLGCNFLVSPSGAVMRQNFPFKVQPVLAAVFALFLSIVNFEILGRDAILRGGLGGGGIGRDAGLQEVEQLLLRQVAGALPVDPGQLVRVFKVDFIGAAVEPVGLFAQGCGHGAERERRESFLGLIVRHGKNVRLKGGAI